MANKLFGRVVDAIIKPTATAGRQDWISTNGQDISFDVEKNTDVEPNKAKISIYNLEKKFRDRLQFDDHAVISLAAGYKDTSAIIFTGNITHAISTNEGPDIVTTIDAAEGHKAYRSSRVAKSYGAGTPYKTVIEDVISSFNGFKVTPAITNVIASIGKTVPNSLTLDGQSARVLNDVLTPLGFAFSMQNGEIQLLESGQPSSQPAVRLTYTSGLVGVPHIGEKKGKAAISFQSFIQPELIPGRRVFVDWIESKGNFVCETVKHKGSNYDNEFYSTVEAKLI